MAIEDTLAQRTGHTAEPSDVLEALKELKPVSFEYSGLEGKTATRFGFLADEVEQTFPELIRHIAAPPKDEATTVLGTALARRRSPLRGIVYQDLIAILTVAVQVQGREMAELNARLGVVEAENLRLREQRAAEDARGPTLEQRVKRLEWENEALRARLGSSVERRLAELEAKFAQFA